MNTFRAPTTFSRVSRALRLSIWVTALAIASSASAKEFAAADRAAHLLVRDGAIDIKAAGPYVELGTFRIRVSAKLGRPTEKLADGTWLYRSRGVKGSDARGTLVVRFTDGRVSDLSLVTPEVAADLAAASQAPEARLYASRR